MLDPDEPAPETLIERARIAEEAARAVEGVTISDGADASWGSHFRGTRRLERVFRLLCGSHHSVSVSVLAGSGDDMERDYDWSSAVYGSDLEDSALVGKRAANARSVVLVRANPRPKKSRWYTIPACRPPSSVI